MYGTFCDKGKVAHSWVTYLIYETQSAKQKKNGSNV